MHSHALDPLILFDRKNVIDGRKIDALNLAAGPMDLDSQSRITQPEVGALVVRRPKAAAAQHIPSLPNATGVEADGRASGIARSGLAREDGAEH
jgi:hypothetical protein